MKRYERKPCSFPGHQLYLKEWKVQHNGMTFSHFVDIAINSLEHTNSRGRTNQAHSHLDLMFNKLPDHIRLLIKATAKSNDPNKQLGAVIKLIQNGYPLPK